MDKPILIGIHGVKRAGKDTTAHFVQDWAARQVPALSTCRRGFADKAKWAFARQFFPDITMDAARLWVDDFKEHPFGRFEVPAQAFGVGNPCNFIHIPFRDVLAQFCTDGARDIYGDDFWVDQLLPMPLAVHDDASRHSRLDVWHKNFEGTFHDGVNRPQKVYLADICTITDLRFLNELDRIRQLGGICWKVRRKDAEDAVIAEAEAKGRAVHRSELGIDDRFFDEIFNNDDNDLVLARHRTEIALNMLTLREDLDELQS